MKHILVVDDDALMSALVQRALPDCHVTIAPDGETALAFVTPGQPLDLVITDYLMPSMTGAELVARLRAHLGEMCGACQMLMSGMSAPADAAELCERIRRQIIDSPQFLLQELVIVEGKRSGQVVRLRREVFAPDEARLNGMAVDGEVVQQTSEIMQIADASLVGQGRWSLAQRTEPVEEMGIAAQLREAVNPRESGAEMSEEPARGTPIEVYGAGPQGEGKSFDLSFKDLFEAGWELTHERCEEFNPFCC